MIWHFPCQVLPTVPTRGSNKKVPNEILLKVQPRALPTTLKVKLCWKWNFVDSVRGFYQTLSKLISCSLPVFVRDILKSLFSSYTDKNHNPVPLFTWNCFMMIIVCVFTNALWEHVPSSNFSQGTLRVQLGKSQVEFGTQILLGEEQYHCLTVTSTWNFWICVFCMFSAL